MEFVPTTKSFSLLAFILLILFIKASHLQRESKLVRNDARSKTSINDESPFRMNKINLIFQKAKRILPIEDLPRLYSELTVQDRLEIEWKKQKAGGLDDDGEQEALIRRKFLSILNQFDLLDIYGGDNGKLENSALDKDQKVLFMEVMKKDKKLAKLWQKAELSAFSEQELEALKVEFGHHLDKVSEYEQLKKDVDRMEAISDNSIQRFKTDDDSHAKLKDKHSALKKAYADVKQSLEYLEKKSAEGTGSEVSFKDPRIAELWSLALKANLSGAELESFREELRHFEHKINKHEYFLKEAELSKANVQIQGKRTEDAPEMYQQLQQRVEDYALKIKKWYNELKMRLAKSPQHREL